MRLLPLAYSFRSVAARPGRTVSTVGVVALVVVATSLLLALVSSLKRTLVSTGDPLNLLVMRKGADNDGSSMVSRDALQVIACFDGVEHDAAGRPLVSPELVVQPFFYTRDGGRENVLVRGVEPVALAVHDDVRIDAGRMFRPSAGEAVIGRGVLGRYVGAALGEEIVFGRGRWTVVGVFDAGGSSFESEVWVDVRELAADSKRPMPFSAFRLRAANAAALAALESRIDGDTRWALEAQPEIEYYRSQATSADVLYLLVTFIAILAGLGAGFGAANTMYAAVRARVAEIGTLRALGFSRLAIMVSFEVEALVLSVVGFVAGALGALGLAAVLARVMPGVGFAAVTFTTNVVTIRVTSADLLGGLALALAIGAGGGIGPAWRAARLRPIEALRRA